MSRTNRHSFDTTSYEIALQSNRELQDEIKKQLRLISKRKGENRQRAAKVVGEIVSCGSAPWIGQAEKAPCCKWDRSFFKGPGKGTVPLPNQDTQERRIAEESTFLRSSHPPWSKAELKLLSAAIQAVEEETKGNQQLDYELVAKSLEKKKKKMKGPMTAFPRRNATECELAQRQLCMVPLDKNESDDLARLIRNNDENGDLSKECGNIDWQAVADAMGTRRSAWECFCEYQTTIAKRKSQPWTLLQDELLFKYVAAMGPQLVIDGNEMTHLRSGLFMDKTKRALFDRINISLLNPNLKHDGWSEEEERRLVLCMKVYSDQPSRALFLAGTHIFGRSVNSVGDKWNRSLNPAYSARPFTKQEDEALLRAMRQHQNLGWIDISRRFFPDRHPHRLMNRWSELATDEDILTRHGEFLLQRASVTATSSAATEVTATGNTDVHSKANHLVVQVRKRKR